jgi:hypothetical protein
MSKQFDHMYDITFSVVNGNEDGEVTGAEVRDAILDRLARLDNDEILEAIGYCDTYEVEDEEPMSECCGATLLHYDNGLGLCAECKEWSGPYQDEDEVKEDAAVVRDLMEAAQCLNEAYYSTPEDHPLREWQERYGIAEVRDQLNLCAIYCDNLYRYVMSEQGYDNCFDFDFCPQFLENCVDHGTFKPKSENMHILSMYWSGIGA